MVVGPAAVFEEVARFLAGEEPVKSFADDDFAVTDAYVFALSWGNTELSSYLDDALTAFRLVVFFPYADNSELEQLAHREIASKLDRHLGGMPQVSAELSGLAILWAHMDGAISRGQVVSVLTMMAACFAIFLRDPWRKEGQSRSPRSCSRAPWSPLRTCPS